MKQIIQDLKNGRTLLEEVPAPVPAKGHVLIRTRCSLVSPGTERMLLQFGRANWIGKARQQPEKLRQMMDKIRTDGLRPTAEAVFKKLDQPLPLGYANAGVVIAVGEGVTGFRPGDRVASNGYHAEIVSVQESLVAKVPENVSDEEAAFTVIAAIALQGIRLAAPTLGETVVVYGLGLIGQLTAQLLLANGCRVIGIDINEERRSLASARNIIAFDPQQAMAQAVTLTEGAGADAVIITTSSGSNEIVSNAAKMSRKRGRIILTGVAGLELNRSDFYEKELSFQVSCSYGPGRYDYSYEQKGLDYPTGYVRWTEQRNFQAVLEAMSTGRLDVKPLITARYPLGDFETLYDQILDGKQLACLIEYDQTTRAETTIRRKAANSRPGKAGIGIIGAGNFAGSVVLPALAKLKANLLHISSAQGLNAAVLAKKHEIAAAGTDYREMLQDEHIDTVFILSRHDQHAQMAAEALRAGKHVFVEKPLAINHNGLTEVSDAYSNSGNQLVVGFNRRFAPFTEKIKSLISPAPMNIVVTVNAGTLPANHWLNDPEASGGRIIGEGCHFIHLCACLSGSSVEAVCAQALGNGRPDENWSIMLRLSNGSNASIHYFSNGHKSHDKERIEIYQEGRTLVLENWRKLSGFGFKGFSTASAAQDKGHQQLIKSFLDTVKKGGAPLMNFGEIVNSTRASFAVMDSLSSGGWVDLY